jgi:hypothetical protein
MGANGVCAMILYDLKCEAGHAFEAWFKDSKTYDRQAKAGRVACPACGQTNVSKALMAPNISSGAKVEKKEQAARRYTNEAAQTLKAFAEFRKHIEQNCDYVGSRFAEEARKIHYGETDAKAIYGEATIKEAKELADEGVPCAPLPWPKDKDA